VRRLSTVKFHDADEDFATITADFQKEFVAGGSYLG
jgi:hypothetical protein